MKKLCAFLCLMCLTAALSVPASAAGPLEYSIDAPGDPDYGTPTSFEPVITADGGARKNEDISKNAALKRFRENFFQKHGGILGVVLSDVSEDALPECEYVHKDPFCRK